MRLTSIDDGERWGFSCKFTENYIAAQAGFLWDPDTKLWVTSSSVTARTLSRWAPPALRSQLESRSEVIKKQDFHAPPGYTVPIPLGKELLHFQFDAVAYAEFRPHTLIGDDMGLGKTIEAIAVVNKCMEIDSVIIVCPPYLTGHWAKSWNEWSTRGFSVGVVDQDWPDTDVVILGYTRAMKYHDEIRGRFWGCAIADECHALKSKEAQRTIFTLGGRLDKHNIRPIPAKKWLYISGTPVLNRPVELWPILRRADPTGLGANYTFYVKRYCGAIITQYGWDVSGSSNLGELSQRLFETFMIRRLKKDVLKDLAPKKRTIITIDPGENKHLLDQEIKAWKKADSKGGLFQEMSKLRIATGKAKIPAIVKFLEEMLEHEKKVVFFAYHREVAEAIHARFGNSSVLVYGGMHVTKRDELVSDFQTNDDVRLFVGTILGAAMGITLTAARRIVIGETDWSFSMLEQAEDRVHRIGQGEEVEVSYMVFEGSLDEHIAAVMVEKSENVGEMLGDE